MRLLNPFAFFKPSAILAIILALLAWPGDQTTADSPSKTIVFKSSKPSGSKTEADKPKTFVYKKPSAKTQPGVSISKSTPSDSQPVLNVPGYVSPAGRTNNLYFDFIIIDAGHGGRDGGAKGAHGTLEKRLTLAVAKKVSAYVRQKHPRLKIYMTRTNDRYVSLEGRTRLANRKYRVADNGLFVSIHMNKSRSSRVYGFETYYLSERGNTAEERELAAFENKHLVPKTPYSEVARMESAMLMAQIKKREYALGRIDGPKPTPPSIGPHQKPGRQKREPARTTRKPNAGYFDRGRIYFK